MKQSKRLCVVMGRGGVMVVLLLLSFYSVHAADSSFIPNFISDPITKSMQGIEVFLLDFFAYVLDFITLLLFILWIGLCVGVVWLIWFAIQLPSMLKNKDFQNTILKLVMRSI